MRKASFSSLVFAFLASISLVASAVPFSEPQVSAPTTVQSAQSGISNKVDLNSADADTFRNDLFGIGAAKAKAIVAYRESNGPFTSVDELLEVKGIGKALLEKNRARLEIK